MDKTSGGSKEGLAKLEEETDVFSPMDTKINFILSKYRDCYLPPEAKLVEHEKLKALLATTKEVSLATREILKKFQVNILDGEFI